MVKTDEAKMVFRTKISPHNSWEPGVTIASMEELPDKPLLGMERPSSLQYTFHQSVFYTIFFQHNDGRLEEALKTGAEMMGWSTTGACLWKFPELITLLHSRRPLASYPPYNQLASFIREFTVEYKSHLDSPDLLLVRQNSAMIRLYHAGCTLLIDMYRVQEGDFPSYGELIDFLIDSGDDSFKVLLKSDDGQYRTLLVKSIEDLHSTASPTAQVEPGKMPGNDGAFDQICDHLGSSTTDLTTEKS